MDPSVIRVMEEKKLNEVLDVAKQTLTKVQEEVKRHSKVPKRESVEQKAERKLELVAANTRLVEAKVEHGSAIGACYDLFHQLLADEPQAQWDRIVFEVHSKDPWTGLNGKNTRGFASRIPGCSRTALCSTSSWCSTVT